MSMTKKNWLLLALCVISLIGCIVTFAGRSLLILFVVLLLLFTDTLLKRLIFREKKKALKVVGLILVNAVVVIWFWTFYKTSFPSFMISSAASEYNLKNIKGIEEVQIPTGKGELDGWLYKQSDEKAPLIIFFYGSGMCAAQAFDLGQLHEKLPGYNVLCIDYPSYGYSEGTLTEASMKKMALAVYDTAITWDYIDATDIVAMGYSLGTGPASYIVAKRDLPALVLISPYDYLHRVYGFPDVLKFCFGYNVNPASFARKIDEPTIIIASKNDERISYNHSMNVARKLENCKVDTFNTYKHDNMLNSETFGLINDYLDNTTLTE